MSYLIGFLWFFQIAKFFSFYLYLWQLKEYHVGRFQAHFETEKGRKLLYNKLFFIKLFLIILYFFSFLLFIFSLFLLYFFGFLKILKSFLKRELKTPVFTVKSSFLLLVLILVQTFFLITVWGKENFFLYLLIFDTAVPIISSFIILLFQPLTIIIRNYILEKAKKKRENFKNLKTIGITGSYGKTSTKEFLAAILSEKFNVLKTPDHRNSEMGISKTILRELNSNQEIFICEMGAYDKGGIKLLCDIAKPQMGILTGVNKQHLSVFKTMDRLLSAEGGEELLSSLPEDGTMIFNGNNRYAMDLHKKSPIESFASEKDVWAEEIKEEIDFVSFKACFIDGESFFCKINLLGKQNIENLLLAFLVARKLGMDTSEIKRGCSKIKPEQGGVSFLKNEEDYKIIDSTYSANPNSVIALLDYLKIFPSKKTIVMPCLIELGEAAPEIHREIGKKIGETCDSGIITTKDYFKEIREGAGIKRNNILFMEDPSKIIQKIKETKGVILLKGRINKKIIDNL